MIKKWSRDCEVEAEVEVVYSGSQPIRLVVHKLKVKEVANKDRAVLKRGVQKDLAVESRTERVLKGSKGR